MVFNCIHLILLRNGLLIEATLSIKVLSNMQGMKSDLESPIVKDMCMKVALLFPMYFSRTLSMLTFSASKYILR